MSKIGKKSIYFDTETDLSMNESSLTVKGKLGEMNLKIDSNFEYLITENSIKLTPKTSSNKIKMKWGLYRALINNMVIGVSQGYKKELELVGIGYRVHKKGSGLEFSLGYSHPIQFPIEEGLSCEVKGSRINVCGIDKGKIGLFCQQICELRKQDPYKGKGVYIVGKPRRRKQGKK